MLTEGNQVSTFMYVPCFEEYISKTFLGDTFLKFASKGWKYINLFTPASMGTIIIKRLITVLSG